MEAGSQPSSKPLRIIVVGGGIAGLALARGLIRSGHEVTVLEKASGLRTDGAAISIWFNGAAALEGLGVSLDACGQRIDRLELRRPSGRILAGFDAVRLAERFGIEARTVPRRLVLEHLAKGLPPGVLRYGACCVGVRQDPARAVVEVEGEGPLSADLVVGADGWRSVVRTGLGDEATVRPVGVGAWQFLIPAPQAWSAGNDFLYLIGRRSRAGFMPAGNGLLQAWFDVPWREGDPRPTSVLGELRRHFGSWTSPVPEVLGAAGESDAELWQYVYRPVPRTLGAGRIAIVGDAAHTMPPYLAQGANQAFEDACVLSRLLATGSGPAEAIASYTRLRRRRTAMVSRFAASGLAAGDLGWLDWLIPRNGPPESITTSVYGAFFRAASNVLATKART